MVKCAVVQRWAPEDVRESLRMMPTDLGRDFSELKRVLKRYFDRGVNFDKNYCYPTKKEMMRSTGRAVAMEVDAVPKGHGKGDGPRSSTAKCFFCGVGGHMAKDCRKKKAEQTRLQQRVQRDPRGRSGVCFNCGRQGHRAKECRSPLKKESAQGQPVRGQPQRSSAVARAAAATGRFGGTCYKCGLVGHIAQDCRRVNVLDEQEIRYGDVQTIVEEMCAIVQETQNEMAEKDMCGLENIDDGNYAVGGSEKMKLVKNAGGGVWPRRESNACLVLIDSGACTHVCPRSFAPRVPLMDTPEDGSSRAVTADGRPLTRWGEREVTMVLNDGNHLKATFQVMDVSRPILSVAKLRDGGWSVHFPDEKNEAATLEREGTVYELCEQGKLYYLPVHITQKKKVNVQENIAAVDIEQRPWMLFDWCCEAESRLTDWFRQHGHAAMRLGLPDFDLSDENVVNVVIDMLVEAYRSGFAVVIWAALPCTPWCTWQRINVHLSDEALRRVQLGRIKSMQMVSLLAGALRALQDARVPAGVVYEWPRRSDGWRVELIHNLWQEFGREMQCDFDGCCYGLKDERGMPLKKPWRVRTNISSLKMALGRLCDRHHEHGMSR